MSGRLLALFVPAALAACRGAPAAKPPAAPAAASPARSHRHQAEVAAQVQPYLDAEELFGVEIGLIDHGDVETYGFAPAGSPVPTETTWFELGSITKLYTAALLADEIGRGEVALTTPVAELLPLGVTVPTAGKVAITLGDLVTHRSGLPRLPPGLLAKVGSGNPYAGYGDADLFADLTRAELEATPGTVVAYSNFGAGLLGWALAHKAGGAYGPVLAERVLGPLGLHDTALAAPAHSGLHAAGHDGDGAVVPLWTFDALAAAGALRSTIADQVRFVRANLDAEQGVGPLAAALKLTHQIQVPDDAMRGAMGWFVDDKQRWWHNGGTGGFHSFIAFDPARAQGVVVLAATSTPLVDGLAVTLLDLLAGAAPPPLQMPTTADLERVVGTYREGGLAIVVSRRGVRLYGDSGDGKPARLAPVGPDSYYVDDLGDVVHFTRDAVPGLVVELGGQRHTLVRVPG